MVGMYLEILIRHSIERVNSDMNNKLNLVELIKYIDPSRLDYQEWVNVGMALKQEGYSEYDWDSWSSRDSSRYHSGECHKKWATFNGSSSPVTGATP